MGPILAVYIRQLDAQLQFYTMTGEWVHRRDVHVSFVVSQMISARHLNPIIPYLPSRPVEEIKLDQLQAMDASIPREAGAMIIDELNHFNRLAAEITRINGSRLNQAFDIMAHPTKYSYATLEDITMKVLQLTNPSELTGPALWAVYKVIAQTHHFRIDFFSRRKFPRIHVMPKAVARDIKNIRTWMREYQEQIIARATGIEAEQVNHDMINPLAGFISKARTLIADSRKRRPITKQGCIGPLLSKARGDPVIEYTFTADEESIIQFLLLWVSDYLWQIEANVTFIGPMILRAVKMYDGFELDEKAGSVFLQELGVVPPWATWCLYNPMFPRHEYHDAQSRFGELALQEAEALNSSLEMNDSMRSFRKDWGDTPVFCLDEAGTEDIDDGLSLEENQNDPSELWVHMHVANPSAFISSTSYTAQLAEALVETLYFPEGKLPMLPRILTENHFSLASNRRCITFSAKLTNIGDIAEIKISHGIIRNVKRFTPEDVDQQLGSRTMHMSQRSKTFVVGDREHYPSGTSKNHLMPASELSPGMVRERILPSDLKLLRKMVEITTVRRRKRSQAGAIFPPIQTDFKVSATLPKGVDFYNPTTWTKRKDLSYDPLISLTATTKNSCQLSNEHHGSKIMLEELMLVAGEVAASWCVQRNIPIAYRGILRNPEPSEPPELYKRKVIDPAMAEKGVAPIHNIIHYLALLGPPVCSAVPLQHDYIGVQAYCKTTSPLRRYVDLLAHWQIEAAIRRESEIGSSLIGSTDKSYLPFSFSRVEALVPRISKVEKLNNHAGKATLDSWAVQLFFRAFYFKETPLPETFEVIISATSLSRTPLHRGYIVDLGMNCVMKGDEAVKEQDQVSIGDIWEAKILEIQCFSRRVVMEPIRLVTRGAEPGLRRT